MRLLHTLLIILTLSFQCIEAEGKKSKTESKQKAAKNKKKSLKAKLDKLANRDLLDPKMFGAIHDFEGAQPPAGIVAGDYSTLSCSGDKSQHGQQSLKWSWGNEGAYIDFDTALMGNTRSRVINNFHCWVYNQSAMGDLEISWGQKSELAGGLPNKVLYKVNFNDGWRSLWIRLHEDGAVVVDRESEEEAPPIEIIRIKSLYKSGEVYFDLLEAGSPHKHGRSGSYQQPWVKASTNRHDYPWYAMSYKRTEPLPEPTEENLRAITNINERFKKELPTFRFGKRGTGTGKILLDDDTRLTGDDVSNWPNIAPMFPAQRYAITGVRGLDLNKFLFNALFYFAAEYETSKDEVWKQKYIQFLDYAHEKGFTYASAMMNLTFVAKNADPYIASLLIMKPHLDKVRLNRQIKNLEWIAGYNNLYNPDVQPVDADKMLGDLRTLLVAIYLQPSETDEEKMKQLYDYIQFSKIVNHTMVPGVSSGKRYHIVGPDYAVRHHGQDSTFGYGGAAVDRYFVYNYILQDSPAQLDKEVAKNLLMVFPRLLTEQGHGPLLAGRGANPTNASNFFRMLYMGALSNLPVAQQWLKYYVNKGTYPDLYITDEIRELVIDNPDVVAARTMSGNLSMPPSGLLVQRRDDWMVALRGMNGFTPSPEMFANPKTRNCANVFGDFQGYGFLQLIHKEGHKAGGTDFNTGGWDWTMYPGATSPQVPHDLLKNTMTNGKFTLTNPGVSGGLSHFKRNGLYYLHLEGYDKNLADKDYPFLNLSGNKS